MFAFPDHKSQNVMGMPLTSNDLIPVENEFTRNLDKPGQARRLTPGSRKAGTRPLPGEEGEGNGAAKRSPKAFAGHAKGDDASPHPSPRGEGEGNVDKMAIVSQKNGNYLPLF
jgi:hypothetical protein